MTGRRVVTDDVGVLQRAFAAEFTVQAAEISQDAGDLSWRCPADRSQPLSFPFSPDLPWIGRTSTCSDRRARGSADHPDLELRHRLAPVAGAGARAAGSHSPYAGRAARARAGRSPGIRRAEVGCRRPAGASTWRSSASARTATWRRSSGACPKMGVARTCGPVIAVTTRRSRRRGGSR